MPIRFGTDGWRGIIAEDFTFDNVRLCAQGTSKMMNQKGLGSKGMVVGYDTRFASEEFAAATAEVLAANNIKTQLTDRPTPTPAVSYNVVAQEAGGGVVITASHNPPQWNGFKFKPDYGGSASPEIVEELERQIAKAELSGYAEHMTLANAIEKGLVEYFDPEPTYLRQIASLVDMDRIRKSGLTILIDSMHGAGAGYLAKLLSGDSTIVNELRHERNPAFYGMTKPEPVAHNLESLMSMMTEQTADVGFATDGDADRLGLVDEHGRFVTTLECFALLCLHQLKVLKRRGPLVRSITMTSMVDRLGEIYGVPVFDTPVGFKYLGPVMMREDALLAGEESGGYAFRGHIPERDGILSGLMILDMMVRTRKTVSELLEMLTQIVGPHHYHRWDLRFAESQRANIQECIKAARPITLAGKHVKKIDHQDGHRFELDDGHWTLVRFSGTEPLLRIYAEAESADQVKALLENTRALCNV